MLSQALEPALAGHRTCSSQGSNQEEEDLPSSPKAHKRDGDTATRVRRELQGSKRHLYNILLVITDGVRGSTVCLLPQHSRREWSSSSRSPTPDSPLLFRWLTVESALHAKEKGHTPQTTTRTALGYFPNADRLAKAPHRAPPEKLGCCALAHRIFTTARCRWRNQAWAERKLLWAHGLLEESLE